MIKQAKVEQLAQQATFIFKGTVKKLKAATMPGVPVTEKTLIMHVDEIMRAPNVLTQYEGADITVQLGSREQIKKGEQAIFYTNSWMIGESLAVRSVGHTTVDAEAASAQMHGRFTAAASSEIDPGLQEQVAQADVVVTGKVTSVRMVDEAADAAVQNPSEQFQPISEHSPVWQEAVIEVTDVAKGGKIPKQIVVRFPTSTDVRWYDVPKLQLGQEAAFLLQKKPAKSAVVGRARAATPWAQGKAGAAVYTALHANAVQPLQKVEAIRTIIKATK